MISAEQIKAARVMLGWNQTTLAKKAKVSVVSVQVFEQGRKDTRISTLNKITTAFEKAGIIFLSEGDQRNGGPGLRLKK